MVHPKIKNPKHQKSVSSNNRQMMQKKLDWLTLLMMVVLVVASTKNLHGIAQSVWLFFFVVVLLIRVSDELTKKIWIQIMPLNCRNKKRERDINIKCDYITALFAWINLGGALKSNLKNYTYVWILSLLSQQLIVFAV